LTISLKRYPTNASPNRLGYQLHCADGCGGIYQLVSGNGIRDSGVIGPNWLEYANKRRVWQYTFITL